MLGEGKNARGKGRMLGEGTNARGKGRMLGGREES